MNLAVVKKACRITDKVFLYVLKTVKVGESEKDLAKRIDNFIKREGAKLSFPTIVAAGSHSYFIHHKPCKRKIRENEPILLDFGSKYNNFCSDLSRTIFIGTIPKEFISLYSIVLKSQIASIKKIEAGISASLIDKIARDKIAKAGFAKEFKHTLGHGLGEKVHQNPSISPHSKEMLKRNDIVTIEPGIYIKGVGGVRIEDDILVKNNGFEVLTKSPKGLREVIIKR